MLETDIIGGKIQVSSELRQENPSVGQTYHSDTPILSGAISSVDKLGKCAPWETEQILRVSYLFSHPLTTHTVHLLSTLSFPISKTEKPFHNCQSSHHPLSYGLVRPNSSISSDNSNF